MKPKYDIDEQVWVIVNETITHEIICPACEEGYITLKDGERYTCPRCRGEGKSRSYDFKYVADPKPRYITGFNFNCEKHHGKIEVNARYYWEDKIDPQHSVYLDSTGDDRGDESMLFPSYEEAVKGAYAAEERSKKQLAEEEAEEAEEKRQKQKRQ